MADFDRCKTEKGQMEFAERYGGFGVGSANFSRAVPSDSEAH